MDERTKSGSKSGSTSGGTWRRRSLSGALPLSAALPLDRASWLRYIAIVVATAAAWMKRRELSINNEVLGIVGMFAVLNLVTMSLSRLSVWARLARLLSSGLGMAGWALLAFLTGGGVSPFIAGLCLEVVFSAVVFAPVGVLGVTAMGTLALWACEVGTGRSLFSERLLFESGFLATIGMLTFLASKRWSDTVRNSASRAAELAGRLSVLEGELDEARRLGHVGENVARLAHGLKNVVHSLRGFTKLMEGDPATDDRTQRIVGGLRLAIDRLEEITATTLRPATEPAQVEASRASAAEIQRMVDDVTAEVGARHGGIRWIKSFASRLGGVAVSSHLLREVLLVLMENAAEASDADGEIVVELHEAQGMLNLAVRDHGPGFAADIRDRIFRLGATTKCAGNGFGLFLARRLVEAKGGSLVATPVAGGGAQFSVRLPVLEN